MVLKPLKTLLCAMSFLLLCNTNSLAEEKYSANECFEKLSRGTLKFNMALELLLKENNVDVEEE